MPMARLAYLGAMLLLLALVAQPAVGATGSQPAKDKAPVRGAKKLAKDHVMMQVFSEKTSGADRLAKFKVRKARPAPPPCPQADGAGSAEDCEANDELSLR
mmetsp:Transcript_46153/g.103795  ORF Transcript_46153/g.103795 Transcript_46153/m.103795 type:complete len:101 (-) Transcript_46153:69-371(-)